MKVVIVDVMLSRLEALLQSAVKTKVDWVIRSQASEAEVCAWVTDAGIFVGVPFTRPMAEAAHALRLVHSPGAGVDLIDLDALPPGVIVANTYHHERAIAEHVLMSMLALSRRLLTADDYLRQGLWDSVFFNPATPLSHTLHGRAAGLVGYGHIGREVARLCRCFGMRVGVVRRNPAVGADEADFLGGPANLPELLRWSDFVVVAAPISAETRGMIGRDELAAMKPTAYLINVGRAAIIDEVALYEALAEQRLAGAALDVWYNYPVGGQPALPASLPFHQLDNVILTPHHSGLAHETFRGRALDVAENIDRLAEGRPLLNVVRPG